MARKQIEVNEAGFRLCSSEGCNNLATHWYVWTNEPVMQCAGCVQRMAGIGQAMGHLAPVASVRLMTAVEMQPSIMLESQRVQLLSKIDTLIQAYKEESSEYNWNEIAELVKLVSVLKPNWIVRELTEGISQD